ncbi:biotin transporter BioY [Effusibacillus lacus]|uniref:Biotin transporter n=1 Tax=Effusibacillus lacus TaxID=1348429 RepID=A0A292YJL4_9BACL|nr:biotin transporter BioY [Effusibacillus lacus]TCS75488.1 biotin transport system substrate-specific component [Effusibacillus lacus]GAX88953.1 hypothetical protein EFBL_0567 [Effusibacillus lacus]
MNKWTTRGLVFSALFAAIYMALTYGKLYLPISPVPISLSNFGVMLAGSILGARYGFLAVAIVVALAFAGLPVFGGNGGIALLLGPSGGFILMQPFAALLLGCFASGMVRDKLAFIKLLAANFLFGSLFLYPIGLSWLAYKLNWSFSKAIYSGFLVYMPGDILKAAVCTVVALAVWRVYPTERITGQTLVR